MSDPLGRMVAVHDDEIEFRPWRGKAMGVRVFCGEQTEWVRDEIIRRWNAGNDDQESEGRGGLSPSGTPLKG